jgi:hypothetical protein
MIKKITFIICLIICVFQIQNISSLKMLEPIIQEIDYTNYVNIGHVSSDEGFLISFLLENQEDYYNIELNKDSENIAVIENIQKTKESIFTTIKIKKDIEGYKEIKLNFKSLNNKDKIITLTTNINSNVLYNIIEPYKKESKINVNKEINIKIFNKANSTKKVVITSDLSDYWFSNNNNNNNNNNNKFIYDTLQPNSSKIIKYVFTPPVLGTANFNLYLFHSYDYDKSLEENLENTNSYKIEKIEIETIKTLNSIFQTKRHQLPLFGISTLPIYFFNNIIRIL